MQEYDEMAAKREALPSKVGKTERQKKK